MIDLVIASGCMCGLAPGHKMPNRDDYLLDHRCPQHGEDRLPLVWGRHKDLVLHIKVAHYNVLAEHQRQTNDREARARLTARDKK